MGICSSKKLTDHIGTLYDFDVTKLEFKATALRYSENTHETYSLKKFVMLKDEEASRVAKVPVLEKIVKSTIITRRNLKRP